MSAYRVLLPICALLFPPTTASAIEWRRVLHQPDGWYATDEAQRVADNVVAYQSPNGGWAKNVDMARGLSAAQLDEVRRRGQRAETTIDNGATHTQIRFLARVHAATGVDRYCEAARRGVDYLLAAQYPSGGWPQFYPLRKGYYSHITFNDGAMIGVMRVLRDAATGQGEWVCLDRRRRRLARRAVQRGVQAILAMQIEVDGRLTAWCAQHDAHTLAPAKARSYELPSISGYESVGVVEFLMGIDNPSPEVVQAVEAAIAWFERSAIEGYRVEDTRSGNRGDARDRRLVKDPDGERLWARFYDIPTNTPLYVGRDGVVLADYNQVERERRLGYNYVGPYARGLLAKRYPQWAARPAAP